MKNNTATIALMAIIAIGSGVAGFTFATNGEIASQATSFVVKPMMSGHLTLEVKDADGNLKAYRQTDNIITQQGENCALRLLFTPAVNHASNSGTGVCAGAFTSPFNAIAVGTGGTQEAGTQTGLVTELTTLGLGRAGATSTTWSNATGAEPNKSAQIILSKTFSVTGTATIQEAGLFNDTTKTDNTDAMFARKTFSGVTVNNLDSLTVSWTINVGNTTSLN